MSHKVEYKNENRLMTSSDLPSENMSHKATPQQQDTDLMRSVEKN